MKISILTPSFNSSNFIERAIKSVLNQDYDNWEHIVIDGGSTDDTVSILKKYTHLKWISEADKGQSDAMNKAFDISSGDIIVYLNADDEFEPNIFNSIITSFQDYNTQIVVGNLYQKFPEKEKLLNQPSIDLYKVLNYWPCHFPLNPVSYFYKKEVQLKIGKFPLGNHYTMDYWFLLRAIKNFNIIRIEKPFGTFYYYDNKSSDEAIAKINLRKVRNEFLIENPIILFKFLIKQNTRIPSILNKIKTSI